METRDMYAGDWLKIGVNVNHGDIIRILDEGEHDEKNDRLILLVSVVEGGELGKQRKFTLNATNWKLVSGAYGTDSKNWVNKEFEVIKVQNRNPKTGERVDSIELVLPNDSLQVEASR